MSLASSLKLYLHSQLGYAYIKFRNSTQLIEQFHGMHSGRPVICVGAGPSINKENLALLNDQVVIFVNGSYRLLKHFTPSHAYWIVQDHKGLYRFLDVDRKLFSASFRTCHDFSFSLWKKPFRNEDIVIMPYITWTKSSRPLIQYPGKHFSFDLAKHIGMTPTVIFSAIQIAAYMGASRIGLLGVDMDYNKKSVHFYSNTQEDSSKPFGNYELIFRPIFEHYHKLLNAESLRLVNCTCETREDVLPTMELQDFVSF